MVPKMPNVTKFQARSHPCRPLRTTEIAPTPPKPSTYVSKARTFYNASQTASQLFYSLQSMPTNRPNQCRQNRYLEERVTGLRKKVLMKFSSSLMTKTITW